MAKSVSEGKTSSSQPGEIYLKAFPLKDVEELSEIKRDIAAGMILILRVTPLAQKDVQLLKQVVGDLYDFTVSIGGDMARLGDERIVITPPKVKIWRGIFQSGRLEA